MVCLENKKRTFYARWGGGLLIPFLRLRRGASALFAEVWAGGVALILFLAGLGLFAGVGSEGWRSSYAWRAADFWSRTSMCYQLTELQCCVRVVARTLLTAQGPRACSSATNQRPLHQLADLDV